VEFIADGVEVEVRQVSLRVGSTPLSVLFHHWSLYHTRSMVVASDVKQHADINEICTSPYTSVFGSTIWLMRTWLELQMNG
jgi:hypothetical protein